MGRYIDLIADKPLIWGLFIAYMLGTTWLAWLGHKKTGDLESYSIGKGDMPAWVVGVTLAASIASTATFVINPGFVYVHGLSAFMHLGVAAGLGIFTGLFVMSFGFRRIGAKAKALTLPQWLGQRYKSKAMTIGFAAVNMLSVTFVVLIVGGLSIVMQQTLGLSNIESLLLVIGFVFSYIFLGGTYAHAYTNTLQGVIMTVIAAIIVFSGLHHFGDGVGPALDQIAAIDPNLVKTVNPDSNLFGSFFSVWIAGFVIGFALVSQPHIMIKALYVKDDREVWKFLAVCIGVSVFFTSLLLVGLYAHLMGIGPEKLMGPDGNFRQDMVMTVYIIETFSPTMVAIITVALLAAGMSTLDGILIALSSIAANDFFLNLTENNLLAEKSRDEQLKIAHRAGQLMLIVLAVVTFLIALNPPQLLGIFGQVGVYGIVAASCAPILFGILFPNVGKGAMGASALVGIGTHLTLFLAGEQIAPLFGTDLVTAGFANPGVTAAYGLIASAVVALPACVYTRLNASEDAGDEGNPLMPDPAE